MSAFLQTWCIKALESGIVQMMSLAKTLSDHAMGILNCFHFPISSGKLEGINKVGCLKRAAFGYRDEAFFSLKLHSLHKSSLRLSGVYRRNFPHEPEIRVIPKEIQMTIEI